MISFLVSQATVSIIQYRRLRYVDVAIMLLNRFGVDICWVMITFKDQEKDDRGTYSRLIVSWILRRWAAKVGGRWNWIRMIFDDSPRSW